MFIGKPLATDEEIGERLSKKKALAIFSSDAISSSAYATEEILRRAARGGRGARSRSASRSPSPSPSCSPWCPRATARSATHIPNGGGAYAVGRANFGKLAGIVAAGALLVDYILTVAVSISSAVEQITSADPGSAAVGRRCCACCSSC